MTDLPQEERLKSDQLQSLTECEQAIYAIAKKTGKSRWISGALKSKN